MNVDHILAAFNQAGVDYVLIGGMNFFLVHEPVSTFDVDLWIDDSAQNLKQTHRALSELSAEVSFDPKGDDWCEVSKLGGEAWIKRAPLFCLNSPHGAIDIFRHVPGLEEGFDRLKSECPIRNTPGGVPFRSLSDRLMIACQLALSESQRKQDRLRSLGYSLPRQP